MKLPVFDQAYAKCDACELKTTCHAGSQVVELEARPKAGWL